MHDEYGDDVANWSVQQSFGDRSSADRASDVAGMRTCHVRGVCRGLASDGDSGKPGDA